MLTEERFNQILQLVEQKKTVTVLELAEHLNTSESTIRRDLTLLHSRGKLTKVHGGATAADMDYSTRDAGLAFRKERNVEEKKQIANYAASLIEMFDLVYIDAGTTTEKMLDFITEKKAVYVTDAAGHARKLARKGCEVYLLGGRFKAETEAVVGCEAVEGIRKYNFTKGFFGVNGISIKAGYATPDIEEAMVKQEALKKCSQAYILADTSKFDKVSPVTFGALSDAVILTTKLEKEKFREFTKILEAEK